MTKGWHGDPLAHAYATRGQKMPKNLPFRSIEELIILHLKKAQRPLTASELTQRSYLAWETVNKYLLKLEESGQVKRVKISDTPRFLWESNDF